MVIQLSIEIDGLPFLILDKNAGSFHGIPWLCHVYVISSSAFPWPSRKKLSRRLHGLYTVPTPRSWPQRPTGFHGFPADVRRIFVGENIGKHIGKHRNSPSLWEFFRCSNLGKNKWWSEEIRIVMPRTACISSHQCVRRNATNQWM